MKLIKKEIGIAFYFIRNALAMSKTYPLVVLLSSILGSVFPFVAILLPRFIIDELMGEQRVNILFQYIVIAASLTLLANILSRTCDRYIRIKYRDITNKFISKTGQIIMEAPYAKLEDPDFIDQKERALVPIQRGSLNSFFEALPELVRNIVTLASVLVIILTFDFIVIILMLVVVAITTYFNSVHLKKEAIALRTTMSANKAFNYYFNLVDDRKFAKDIRLHDLSGFVMDNVRKWEYENFNNNGKPLYWLRGFYEGLKIFLVAVQNFVIYAYIGIRSLQRGIPVGDFTMYIAAAVTFGNTTSRTITLLAEIRQHCGFLEDYMVFNKTTLERETGKMLAVDSNKVEFEFKNVCFSYPGTDKPVLKDISFKINSGESVSIVGRNGAGKTTFIKLISRLYKLDSGEILLNGININDFQYDEYMKLISVVFQDFRIFDLTIADNVGFDNPDEGRVESALKMAGIFEFVNNLPKKINNYIGKSGGEDGVFLSGGEMQKIAIARTIYKNSPMIILDEPTAALDPMAEAEVYEKFNEIIENKTAVYISHRLSSCKFCDKIVFIDDGEVKEEGSHEELMKCGGDYAAMFNLQAERYLNSA